MVDGIRGQQVERAMRQAVLSVGSNNSLVGWLQCRLSVGIDNIFGNQTKQAVINYQKANGLSADGIVGYNTWNSLMKKYNW